MRRTPLTTTLCHPAAEKPSYATQKRAIYKCCVRQTSSARLCRSQSTVTCRASPAATPPLMLLLLLLLATVLTITRRTAADCAATTDTRRSAHLPMTSSVTCAARAPTTRGRRRSRTATDNTSVSVSYRRIHDVSSLCLSRANETSETAISRVRSYHAILSHESQSRTEQNTSLLRNRLARLRKTLATSHVTLAILLARYNSRDKIAGVTSVFFKPLLDMGWSIFAKEAQPKRKCLDPTESNL